jgi:formiminoglutamase
VSAPSPAPFIELRRGAAPLLVSIPHTGTEIPEALAGDFVSPWQALRDADWWIDRLYDFAPALDATVIRTRISRSVIDVNRDPSGASLYPGQATTGLCPTTDFDGAPLYRDGREPDEAEIARRRQAFHDSYHDVIADEIARLRALHGRVVLYDCHSIRSVIPRLFEGELPVCNIGTDRGRAADPRLAARIAGRCAEAGFSHVTNGRFVGGWITRRHGAPAEGVHAVQMELACRGYMEEPSAPSAANWPTPYDPARAATLRGVLEGILRDCLDFANSKE